MLRARIQRLRKGEVRGTCCTRDHFASLSALRECFNFDYYLGAAHRSASDFE
jgi:hypothetical protein